MGFFDSIVNAADNLGAKVSGNVDAMGINSQVTAKEKEMNNLYAQLGMAYYSIHKDDPDDACRNLVQLLINKEVELNKLKGDLAAKKAETAAIGQQNNMQQGMYQQPVMGQSMNQPVMGQPMGQPMNQPVMGQPMGQPMNQPVMGQPMGQPMNQPVMGQPMGQPVNQPVMGQADAQSVAPVIVPVKQDASEGKTEESEKADKAVDPAEAEKADGAEKADEAENKTEPEKKSETEGKTCSVCGAVGQTGLFCGNCGNKLD